MAVNNIPALVTLTTDFGTSDPYVASMKGVLHSRCPGVRIEDLCHEIPPQALMDGAIFLACAIPYFPKESIHVVVVDPGVGTERHAIIVRAGDRFFVCPDNGLLTLFLRDHPLQEARVIQNPVFMSHKISATFHGRDIFAPAAATLASGVSMAEAGAELDTLTTFALPDPSTDQELIQGQVIHVDHFGNCVTNVHQRMLTPQKKYQVQFAATTIPRIERTYAEGPYERPLALFGSCGFLEIALREGNAERAFGIKNGDAVTIYPADVAS